MLSFDEELLLLRPSVPRLNAAHLRSFLSSPPPVCVGEDGVTVFAVAAAVPTDLRLDEEPDFDRLSLTFSESFPDDLSTDLFFFRRFLVLPVGVEGAEIGAGSTTKN